VVVEDFILQTPQTITSFYAGNTKGLALSSLHNGSNPPSVGSSFYGPNHSTQRIAFAALFGGDLTEQQALDFHDAADQFTMRLHRNYSMSLDDVTDIFASSSDDFAGAYWSSGSTSEPDNGYSGTTDAWRIKDGGTYTLESGSDNVLYGTTSIRYSGSVSGDEIYTEFVKSDISVSDVIVVRGYAKQITAGSADSKVTLYDSVNGVSDIILDNTETTNWQYFELEHTVGSVADNNLALYIRGGGEFIIDGLELYIQ
jgi:hypothetical protein